MNDGNYHRYSLRISSTAGTDFFVDGVNVSHTATTASTFTTKDRVYFGYSGDPASASDRNLVGEIDEARIYSRVLSNAEVMADAFDRGVKTTKSYFYHLDTAPSSATSVTAVYSGTTNGETLTWGDTSTVVFDGISNLDPLFASGIKRINYNTTRNSFSVLSNLTPTQFFKTDNALNATSIVGINSSVDVATTDDNYYTLSSTGLVVRYNSLGVATANTTVSGYSRIVYADRFSASVGNALVAVNGTGFQILNSTTLATISTSNWNTLY